MTQFSSLIREAQLAGMSDEDGIDLVVKCFSLTQDAAIELFEKYPSKFDLVLSLVLWMQKQGKAVADCYNLGVDSKAGK
jgi:hypothetical protein